MDDLFLYVGLLVIALVLPQIFISQGLQLRHFAMPNMEQTPQKVSSHFGIITRAVPAKQVARMKHGGIRDDRGTVPRIPLRFIQATALYVPSSQGTHSLPGLTDLLAWVTLAADCNYFLGVTSSISWFFSLSSGIRTGSRTESKSILLMSTLRTRLLFCV